MGVCVHVRVAVSWKAGWNLSVGTLDKSTPGPQLPPERDCMELPLWQGRGAHLVVVSLLPGHRFHGQSSQAEVMFQKQGVDVLQWHLALWRAGLLQGVNGRGWGPGGWALGQGWYLLEDGHLASLSNLHDILSKLKFCGRRGRGLQAAGVWVLLAIRGWAGRSLTIVGSLVCPSQQLLGIAAPCLGILQGSIHTTLGPNESQV